MIEIAGGILLATAVLFVLYVVAVVLIARFNP